MLGGLAAFAYPDAYPYLVATALFADAAAAAASAGNGPAAAADHRQVRADALQATAAHPHSITLPDDDDERAQPPAAVAALGNIAAAAAATAGGGVEATGGEGATPGGGFSRANSLGYACRFTMNSEGGSRSAASQQVSYSMACTCEDAGIILPDNHVRVARSSGCHLG